MFEKSARKPSSDPVQERLRRNKANWNKEVSQFVNDVIHLKKMMNGWPSKFFKERSRIVDPLPADPATIIGALSGDFQEIAQRGQAIVQEQLNYSKTRRRRQPRQLNLPLPKPQTPTPAAPQEPQQPQPDLSKQLSLPAVASRLERKYAPELTAEGSNPFTRAITRLITPTIGFGESARIRRLRMTLLTHCVNTLKDLKRLHNEIVKSNKGSIFTAHKIMSTAFNHWRPVKNAVVRAGGSVYSSPEEAKEDMDDTLPSPKEEAPKTAPPAPAETAAPAPEDTATQGVELPQVAGYPGWVRSIVLDFLMHSRTFAGHDAGGFMSKLEKEVNRIRVSPQSQKARAIRPELLTFYENAIFNLNQEFGTGGGSLGEILNQIKSKAPAPPAPLAPQPAPQPATPVVPPSATTPEELTRQAQVVRRWLRKFRHQLVPGGSSGSRLEIYQLISETRKNLNRLMDLLEKGFDLNAIAPATDQVHRQMVMLRKMVSSMHYATKPEDAPQMPPFF